MKARLNGVTSQHSNRRLQPMRLQYCCTVTSHHSNRDVTISQIVWIYANYTVYGTRGAVSFRIQHSVSPRAVSGTQLHPSCRMPRKFVEILIHAVRIILHSIGDHFNIIIMIFMV